MDRKALSSAAVTLLLTAGLTLVTTASRSQEAKNTIAELAQQAVEAALAAQTAAATIVPKGAVMAFNLPECPMGWRAFAPLSGRVVVGAGAGNRDSNDHVLTERKLGQSGGEEAHKLTIPEMPSHNHGNGDYQNLLMYDGNYTMKDADPSVGEPNIHSFAPEKNVGGDQPHNNMQPYFVLTYCERE